MKPKIKTKWLKALRSGKYTQANSSLSIEGKFCCLGVLADIVVQETPHFTWEQCESEECRGLITVSSDMVDYAKLPDDFCELVEFKDSFNQQVLIQKNDDGETFEQIADWIERNL